MLQSMGSQRVGHDLATEHQASSQPLGTPQGHLLSGWLFIPGCPITFYSFLLLLKVIYLFIFGCAVFSLLREDFLYL